MFLPILVARAWRRLPIGRDQDAAGAYSEQATGGAAWHRPQRQADPRRRQNIDEGPGSIDALERQGSAILLDPGEPEDAVVHDHIHPGIHQAGGEEGLRDVLEGV